MNKLFTSLYDLLRRRRPLLWTLLALSTLVMGWFATRLSFAEDITSFLPDDRQGRQTASIFRSLRIKDKIVIMLSAREQAGDETPDRLVEAADAIAEGLGRAVEDGLLESVTARIDADLLESATDLVYGHLPALMSDADLGRLDSLTRPETIDSAIRRAYGRLTSPAGIALREFIQRDPLGLGTPLMAGFQQFNTSLDYELYDDHLFTPGLGTLLLFATPAGGSSATADNERLVTLLEEQLDAAAEHYQVQADYFGAVGVAVYNARQIKRDTMGTLTVALIVIVVVITLVFRNRWAVPLMMLPALYGALFALAAIYFIQGSVSAIAIGAGAAVLGVALSYSIHVLAHSNHIHDPRRVVEELAYPLTVGSITTIGAFFGLVFTRSQLLHDFGLFSALTLVGTTLFCLVFLPHMLSSDASQRPGRLLERIERMNAYRYDSNRWLAGTLVAATLIGLFFFRDVRFESDMTRLSYEPERFAAAEQRLQELFSDTNDYIYLVTTASDPEQAAAAYGRTERMLDSLAAAGMLRQHASAAGFVVPLEVQRQRIAAWESFWSPAKRAEVERLVAEAARRHGLRADAFAPFNRLLEKRFTPFDAAGAEASNHPVLGEWLNRGEEGPLYVSRITLNETDKERVYASLERIPQVGILDRAYFASRMADVVNDDFNTILMFSSALVFCALLLSYGRIELALLASLPMAMSWVLILGMMALLGIEFNIVNIILSTFIFGLGDDFSIFIMDGLLSRYRNGRRLLAAHKTAIFFSAFTTVVGIGTLVFARHPALHSLSFISIVGMAAVVLVAYTVQPILFRLFISGQTARGGFPYTLAALLNSLYAFVYFLTGCLLLQLYMGVLLLLPLGRQRRKALLHKALYRFCRLFLATIFTTRTRRINPQGERFERPAVVVANHQSFVDILLLLSLSPRLVMVTNNWVWHSPFFGRIVRFAGFHTTAEGYDRLAEELRKEVADGYSVVIFPEGTRSADREVHRFHKGAFLLAERLGLDIVPVAIYGSGLICSKRQPFYIKRGDLSCLVMERIAPDDARYGSDARTRARGFRRLVQEACAELCDQERNNPYHLRAVIKNYIYKGPVLEWYIRIKLRLERNYAELDRLLPPQGRIVDIGCGYGQTCCMLLLRCPERQLLGIDYDAEKIAVAEHGFLRSARLRFRCADVTRCELPEADAFVINDMLHYIAPDEQERLIARCAERLVPGGCIIVREGDRSRRRRHRLTEETERWSTRILGFNKTCGSLHFPTSGWMEETARRLGLTLKVEDYTHHTSNMRYIFRKGGAR